MSVVEERYCPPSWSTVTKQSKHAAEKGSKYKVNLGQVNCFSDGDGNRRGNKQACLCKLLHLFYLNM